MSRKKPALLLFMLISQTLIAQRHNLQPGYIVTYANDTLNGWIKEPSGVQTSLKFKSGNATNFQEYTTDDIQAYAYVGGYYYRAVPVPDKNKQPQRYFLQCLAEGNLTLYTYKDYFFVQKQGDSLIKLEQKVHIENGRRHVQKTYLGVLAYLMNDCPSVQDKLQQVEFESVNLAGIVTNYNYCGNSVLPVIVHTESARIKLRAGVRLGGVVSDVTYFVRDASFYRYNFSVKNGFTGGLYLNFSHRDKFSVQPELLITSKGATYRGTVRETYTSKDEDVDITLTYLQVPLSFYYTFPAGTIRPFVSAGGVASRTIQRKTAYTIVTRYNVGTGSYTKHPLVKVENYELGYRGGAGMLYALNRRHHLGIEYIFEQTLTNKQTLVDKFRNITHNVSMRVSF